MIVYIGKFSPSLYYAYISYSNNRKYLRPDGNFNSPTHCFYTVIEFLELWDKLKKPIEVRPCLDYPVDVKILLSKGKTKIVYIGHDDECYYPNRYFAYLYTLSHKCLFLDANKNFIPIETKTDISKTYHSINFIVHTLYEFYKLEPCPIYPPNISLTEWHVGFKLMGAL